MCFAIGVLYDPLRINDHMGIVNPGLLSILWALQKMTAFNPTALRKAKTFHSFGHCECNRAYVLLRAVDEKNVDTYQTVPKQ